MSNVEVIVLPRTIADKLRREARKQGLSVEEYLLEVLSQGLDPKDRAIEYVEVARELLEEAREELKKGNVRQAAEKLWGATALTVKAYAYWKEGKRLTSHRELWEYSLVLRKDMGKWVSNAWNAGNAMHICFYEGWCSREHVEDALEEIRKLVREVSSRISK